MSYIEEAISRTGWGLYGRLLAAFAGTTFAAIGITSMSTPLYLPIIACDLTMNDSTFYQIDVSTSLGVAFGGFFFSALADVLGRKHVITLSNVQIIFGILCASFSYNGGGFVLAEFLLGSGLSAGANIVRILAAESLPKTKRGKLIVLLDVFWSLGCVLTLLLSVFFIPAIKTYKTQYVRVFTWRVVYGLSMILLMTMGCFSSMILESPRFLIYDKRIPEALHVIREIFAVNQSRMSSTLMISEDDLQGKVENFGNTINIDLPELFSMRRFSLILKKVHKSMMMLTTKRFIWLTLLMIILRMLTFSGIYELLLLLTKTLIYPADCRIEGMDIVHFDHPIIKDCDNGTPNLVYYKEFLILTAISIVGQVTCACAVGSVERKFLLFAGFFIAGLSAVGLQFIDVYILRFALSGLLVACYAAADSCLNLVVVEMFPTAVRGTAYGETMMLSKILDACFKGTMDFPCNWVFAGIAAMMGVASILSLATPNSKDQPMVD